MEAMDYWRWCTDLSIYQAVMLILGFDPENSGSADIERDSNIKIPEGYTAIKVSLIHALKRGKIEGELREKNQADYYSALVFPESVDIDSTIVSMDSLKAFLKDGNIKSDFFFPQGTENRTYLNPDSPHYAPKLAAAVKVWEAITDDQNMTNGKTPKQAMEKWLRVHASEYGLTKDDGNPNETGIEEICKVANWMPGGGAAKTPTRNVTRPPANNNPPTPAKNIASLRKPSRKRQQDAVVPDTTLDEIPF